MKKCALIHSTFIMQLLQSYVSLSTGGQGTSRDKAACCGGDADPGPAAQTLRGSSSSRQKLSPILLTLLSEGLTR